MIVIIIPSRPRRCRSRARATGVAKGKIENIFHSRFFLANRENSVAMDVTESFFIRPTPQTIINNVSRQASRSPALVSPPAARRARNSRGTSILPTEPRPPSAMHARRTIWYSVSEALSTRPCIKFFIIILLYNFGCRRGSRARVNVYWTPESTILSRSVWENANASPCAHHARASDLQNRIYTHARRICISTGERR